MCRRRCWSPPTALLLYWAFAITATEIMTPTAATGLRSSARSRNLAQTSEFRVVDSFSRRHFGETSHQVALSSTDQKAGLFADHSHQHLARDSDLNQPPSTATLSLLETSSGSSSRSQALNGAGTSSMPTGTGFPINGYHFERPFPYQEDYPENAYTLSGGIFSSVIEGTCQRRAQHSKSGWCQPPCQLEPDPNRKLSSSQYDTMSCLVSLYAPGVRPDKTGHFLDMDKHKLAMNEKTRDIRMGSCACVDPCAMYKNCGECTANKDASELDEVLPPHFFGSLRNFDACDSESNTPHTFITYCFRAYFN
mgnify:CR=1 FL=1